MSLSSPFLYLAVLFRYSAAMRCIFIADAHLRQPGDANYQRLLRFLGGLRGRIDTLFVLGDLFEFWIGYRQMPFPHYQPVLEELRRLREGGVELIYFEGNHDFHMGPFFTETLQAKVYPGPTSIQLDGRLVYLCHGDQINHLDYGNRFLRFVLHSRLTRFLTLVAPPWVASAIAVHLGRKSKAKHGRTEKRWNYPTLIREFARQRFAEGCDVVITGHFHAPFVEGQGSGSHTLVSLGDWITQYSYAEWQDGNLQLREY